MHLFLLLFLQSLTVVQSLSKRGLIYIWDTDQTDYSLFISQNSTLSWYYNYSPGPSLSSSGLPFVPMIHGTSSLSSDISTIKSLGGSISHILTFNEPDGTTESGGSGISPHAAAKAYIEAISPLRSPPHNLQISLPATTGSSGGLQWLSTFNTSCYHLNPHQGCPVDFVAAHWYGDFEGMASWLGTLRALYPSVPIWLTEFAIPQADEDVTVQFLNQSLAYLDGLGYVKRYAWFGSFRRQSAGDFTGGEVAMLNNAGGLTQVGVDYLGGARRGFEVGQKGEAGKFEWGRFTVWMLVLAFGMFHIFR